MTTYHPTYLTPAEAIEPHLSVIYNEEAPVEQLGIADASIPMMFTRITENAVVYRVGDGRQRDDEQARWIAAQLIADGRMPRRGGVVRLTGEEVSA